MTTATPEQTAAMDGADAAALACIASAQTVRTQVAAMRATFSGAPPINALPIVAMTAPTPGQSFTQGAAITLSSTATDSDGTIARVEFYADGALIGQAPASPYSFTWTGAGLGAHSLHAVAYDNAGGAKAADPISISVATAAQPPVSGLTVEVMATDQYIPNPNIQGQPICMALEGFGVGAAAFTYGDQLKLHFTGDLADPNDNTLTTRVSISTLGIPVIVYFDRAYNGTRYVETLYNGWTAGDGVLNQYTRRRILASVGAFRARYPQLDFSKLGGTGGSMGGWGIAQLAIRNADVFAYCYPSRPILRYAYQANQIEAANLTGASAAYVKYPVGPTPVLSSADGGGPAAAYFDLVAYVSNPFNATPFIGWAAATLDPYAVWNDNVAMMNVCRSTKRAFAIVWREADHGWTRNGVQLTDPIALLRDTYGYDFRVGQGLPYLSNSSRDKAMPVRQADGSFAGGDLDGSINEGFKFRNIVETAAGFSFEIQNVLGPTTVTAEPSSSCKVFTKAVAPQTITCNATTWTAVAFS
jgi:hypothetical protein